MRVSLILDVDPDWLLPVVPVAIQSKEPVTPAVLHCLKEWTRDALAGPKPLSVAESFFLSPPTISTQGPDSGEILKRLDRLITLVERTATRIG